MLEIVRGGAEPSPEDWCFVFSGYDVVGSLAEPPGTPWNWAGVAQAFADAAPPLPLGNWAGRSAWVVSVDDVPLDPMRHVASSLYRLLGRVDDHLFGAHGRGLQLLQWQRGHRFCGFCGGATALGDRGSALVCEDCGQAHYPKVAPCAIVLVTRGDELLLAQAAGRGPGFYSTLAGFVEPGESVEATVRREVYEEVGVTVGDLTYFGSQPWPFPGQLMLGFFATYQSGEITPDPDEIADARWFAADDLPPVPPPASISGQLIRHFVNRTKRP